jgi:hypothetical protein
VRGYPRRLHGCLGNRWMLMRPRFGFIDPIARPILIQEILIQDVVSHHAVTFVVGMRGSTLHSTLEIYTSLGPRCSSAIAVHREPNRAMSGVVHDPWKT